MRPEKNGGGRKGTEEAGEEHMWPESAGEGLRGKRSAEKAGGGRRGTDEAWEGWGTKERRRPERDGAGLRRTEQT